MTTTTELSAQRLTTFNYETKTWNVEIIHGTVRIDIDIEAIILKLGAKALRNKTGKAVEFDGLLKATRSNYIKVNKAQE